MQPSKTQVPMKDLFQTSKSIYIADVEKSSCPVQEVYLKTQITPGVFGIVQLFSLATNVLFFLDIKWMEFTQDVIVPERPRMIHCKSLNMGKVCIFL